MASTFFGLHIGSSALSSFQVATNTTANNIANVKTTGYTRQEATLQAKDAINVTARYGSVGTGVTVTSIKQQRTCTTTINTGKTIPAKDAMSRSCITWNRFRTTLRITAHRLRAFRVFFHRCFQTLIHCAASRPTRQ